MILEVDGLTKTIDGEKVLDNVSFIVNGGDKIAFMGTNSLAKTTLFQILAGETKPDSGTFNWGLTITHSYFPKEHSAYFSGDRNLIEWFLQFASRCKFLGDDHLCTIYDKRPQICRDLSPSSCEFALGPGDQQYFTSLEEFDRWLDEKQRRKRVHAVRQRQRALATE